ncbi:hypothetical protein M427DRAFT_132477 [Gonapodya prolifera JEL478]|uniref:HAMP domain-containing protein n=1 Tax=Gonapodya prolifera (strain JEL478) TaxID=1344416 RepID=A0A139AQH3_GONPJ|nr:hypothetical protein M427DRAFT_132477 [Gonapodya prolifera JEL478]|eukprot:KXS19000.1 hypothetical protein M427DRAFT_132477 [Gonapodya prolifera JEL478]
MSVILIIIALLLLLILGPVALIFTELFISRPINCMIDAMEKATRMDFSDVRTGVREPHSLVLEVSNIQSVFIKMLKTFADVLRGGKNTLNKNPVSAAPSVVARTFQSRLEPTTPTHLLSAGDGVGRESDAESGWAMSRSGAVESTVMSSRIERIDE